MMKTLAQYIEEMKPLAETASVRVTAQQLHATIGKTRMAALISHPYWKRHIPSYTEHAFKHRINHLGDHEVEVYPYTDADRVGTGSVRPSKFVRFQFYKHRVTNAHLFRRDPSTDWHWVSSHRED